jgi:hypothetical protein
MAADFPDFPAGPITFEDLRARIRELARAVYRRFRFGVVPPIHRNPDGSLYVAAPQPFLAQLSGSSNPYTATELVEFANPIAALPGGRVVDNAYEANGETGLDGKVVVVRPSAEGDWRFLWDAIPPCGAWVKICFTGCGFHVEGVAVTATRGGDTVFSGTTDAAGCVTFDAGGAGTLHVVAALEGYDDWEDDLDVGCSTEEAPNTFSVILTLEAGARCFCGCVVPNGATATFTIGSVTATATWNPTHSDVNGVGSAGAWTTSNFVIGDTTGTPGTLQACPDGGGNFTIWKRLTISLLLDSNCNLLIAALDPSRGTGSNTFWHCLAGATSGGVGCLSGPTLSSASCGTIHRVWAAVPPPTDPCDVPGGFFASQYWGASCDCVQLEHVLGLVGGFIVFDVT